MSETDELDDIREQKRAELAEQMDGDDTSAADGATPTEPIHVEGADDFAEIVDDHHAVLVDFYADWCGPCKMLEPTVESIAAETEAAVAKVDVDQYQQLAAQYQVQGVPTLILFVDGEAVEQIVGVRDQASLTQLIEQHA